MSHKIHVEYIHNLNGIPHEIKHILYRQTTKVHQMEALLGIFCELKIPADLIISPRNTLLWNCLIILFFKIPTNITPSHYSSIDTLTL